MLMLHIGRSRLAAMQCDMHGLDLRTCSTLWKSNVEHATGNMSVCMATDARTGQDPASFQKCILHMRRHRVVVSK
jgi:hypothetical protein